MRLANPFNAIWAVWIRLVFGPSSLDFVLALFFRLRLLPALSLPIHR